MSLEKMFQQIMQSEQTAKTRRENITKIKREIASAETELKTLKESCASSRGRLRILVRQYHEENAECVALNEQKKALEERRNEILKDIENTKARIKEKQENLEGMQADFSKRVFEFCAEYDLTGEGARKRKEQKVEELKQIKEEIKSHERKLEIRKLEEEKFAELMEQRACLQAEISQLQTQVIEADSTLEQKRLETTEITKKVQKFRNEAHRDPELVQLQKELDSIKINELEQKVRNLKAELTRVKQQQWQGSLQGQQQNRRGPSPREYKFKPVNR